MTCMNILKKDTGLETPETQTAMHDRNKWSGAKARISTVSQITDLFQFCHASPRSWKKLCTTDFTTSSINITYSLTNNTDLGLNLYGSAGTHY